MLVGHVWGTAHAYNFAEATESVGGRLLFGGGYGVYLFFALSGYLLFWPFAKRYFGDGRAIDLGHYARNRALRILPLYFVVMASVLLIQEEPGTLKQWLLFMTWSPNFSSETVGQVNGVVWSVVIELHFYTLLPLLAWGIARIARGRIARAALVLLALAAGTFALRYVTFFSDPGAADPLLRYSLPTTFFYFVAGMLLALVRLACTSGPPAWLRGPAGSANAWVAASAAIWLWIVTQLGQSWALTGSEAVAAVASFLLIGACVLPLRDGALPRGLDFRPLALVGVASYSLYLWHVPILQWMEEQNFGFLTRFPEVLAVAVPVCLLWGLASYAVIESPFLRLRQRWGSTAAQSAEPASPSASSNDSVSAVIS